MTVSSNASAEGPARPPYPPALVDRLLTVIAGLNADLDHDVVLGRICRACVDLVECDAAGFLSFEQHEAHLVAGVGYGAAAQHLRVAIDEQELRTLSSSPRRIVLADVHRDLADRPEVVAALGELRTLILIPVQARSVVVGALVVSFIPASHALLPDQWALLDLLAGHGGAAIANAVAFETAVQRQAHEQAVIDAVADGVATLDAYGMVTGWNRAAAELSGLDLVDVEGRPLPFPVGTPAEPIEHRFADDRWLEIVATPLESGQVVLLRDISRQKALDAAKAMFVAATSHELKTPLTVIKSFADWLRDNGETAEPTRRKTAYDAIAESADELYQIVEKVLLTAKTEAGRIDLTLQRIDAERLVRGAAGPFQFPGRAHLVELDLQPDLPAVWADQQALRTALGQLLENAVKYSPDGGTITVAASAVPTPGGAGLDSQDSHESQDSAAMVRFSVRDQGIGLAPGEELYLFMPFYQGETRSRSGVRGGVGLGLSIVRRLIESHGGTVGANGEPGQGSEFWFTVPIADPELDDLV